MKTIELKISSYGTLRVSPEHIIGLTTFPEYRNEGEVYLSSGQKLRIDDDTAKQVKAILDARDRALDENRPYLSPGSVV